VAACLGLLTASPARPEPAPRPWRIVVLHGADFFLPSSVRQDWTLRETLLASSPRPIEFNAEALDAGRLDDGGFQPELVALLRRKYRDRPPDLVMAAATPALDFVERHRAVLWPAAPVVFYSVAGEALVGRRLGPGVTGQTIRFDVAGTLDLALRLQPRARRAVVVGGVSDYDRNWIRRLDDELRRRDGIDATYATDLPFAQLLDAVAALPSDAFVVYTSVFRDAAGRTFVPRDALRSLARRASVPVYGFFETMIGEGLVGGCVPSFEEQGRRAAALALRVLAGEDAAAIPVQPPPEPVCLVDGRQLERFGLSARALPPGTEVRFQQPSLWRAHRWQVLAVAAALAVQTLLIAALLAQRRRRRQAEAEALHGRAELAHASRLAVVGELTASIAHEINQPLGAILANADAAEMLLQGGARHADQVRRILADIRADDLRAHETVERVRGLLRKRQLEMLPLDPNELVADVLCFVRGDAGRRAVPLQVDLGRVPRVRGDRVHLQQVLLNLFLNGMEAMADTPEARRSLQVRTAANGSAQVEVSVSDAGPGIPAERLARLFDSFFTTKEHGMGLGLSIARSIVEAHGGWIQAENAPGGGATFRFGLPCAEEEA
jgi:signal transduction histidine kinase